MAINVTVCVGSSCHVRGSRDVLKRFAKIIKEENREKDVVLLGSFCRERCGEGTNWQFDDEEISSSSVEEAEQTLRARLSEVEKET